MSFPPKPDHSPGGRYASVDQGGPCPRLRRRPPRPKNCQQVDFWKHGENLEGHIGIVLFGESRIRRQRRRRVQGFDTDASAGRFGDAIRLSIGIHREAARCGGMGRDDLVQWFT